MERSTQPIDSGSDLGLPQNDTSRQPNVEDVDEEGWHTGPETNATTALPSRSQNTSTKTSPPSGETGEPPTAQQSESSPSPSPSPSPPRFDGSGTTRDNFSNPGGFGATTGLFGAPGGVGASTSAFGGFGGPPTTTNIFGAPDGVGATTGLFGRVGGSGTTTNIFGAPEGVRATTSPFGGVGGSGTTTNIFGVSEGVGTATNAFGTPGAPNLGTGLSGSTIRDPPPFGSTPVFGTTIRDPPNSGTSLFGSTIRRDLPTLASHYSFNSQDDQYARLLDSSKIAKETIKLLQEPATTSGFLRPSGMAKGYIAVICFTLHPNLLMIVPSADPPSVDLPLSCKTLQANSETARVTWIKTKHVYRVKELAHLELLQHIRKSSCMHCTFASRPDSAWYDVGLQEGLRVVNQWVDWMDQEPYLPTGHLRPELHKKASAAIELVEQHDKDSPKREWLKDFMKSHRSATSTSNGEQDRCKQQ